ncbi:MAG: glycerophosphodiester phosphodiesterase [Gemmatimonadetes bacterium]|nr:glycerophosphodiester phosphodiesterase [Gemmatimonadota bacterium]
MTLPRALVIAHRGASGYEVENSLAAFRAAGPAGADAVELDIHATADGALVVHHDEMLDGTHHIAHCTAKQVAGFRLENGEPVPTLAEALAVIEKTLKVFVEVKSLAPQFDERLCNVLDQGPNPAGYAVHSFDHRIVRRLVSKRPGLRCGVLSASYLFRPTAVLDDAAARDLWQERTVVDADLVTAVHQAGGRLFVWTVDRADEMRHFLSIGVDGICTNLPDIGRRVVDSNSQ